MNTVMIKRFGIIALGGIAGGVIGYILASLVIDQLTKPREEFWEEWEEPKDTEVKVGKAEETIKKVNKRDYTKFAKADLEELVKPYTNQGKSKQDNIVIVSLQEYESDRTSNREIITYYEGDTTFCDMNEELIPNPEDFFSPNIHLHFGDKSEDPDIVYVKNNNNGVIYEITRTKGKYSVIVMGMPEEEVKETNKSKRRRTTTKKKVEVFEDEESIENEGED